MIGLYKKARKRTFELLEIAKPNDRASRITDFFIAGLILANVLAMIFGSVSLMYQKFGTLFDNFEYFSVGIFSIEYLLRIWSIVESKPKEISSRVRLRYSFTFLAMVDLLAILPAYLPMFLPIDLRVIRLFRLFRMTRILKISRYSKAIQTFSQVLREKKEDLIVAVVAVIFLLLISSSLMYFIENEAQPNVFSSIPAAMWWGVAALTTVGYGDIVPITAFGKMLGTISAILGIGLFALPAGILASGFTDALSSRKANNNVCPIYGKTLDE